MDIKEAKPEHVTAIIQARDSDSNSTSADRRTKAYLLGKHHPGYALKSRVIFYATDHEKVVGYIGGHLTTRFDCDGELQYLWVSTERRRSAIGSSLFAKLAGWFQQQGAERVCVDVVPENNAARSFYRHLGATDLNSHWLVWENIKQAATSIR